MTRSEAGIDLYWLPLGAGGWFVRLNGRIYEAVNALAERRRPLDLYHSALEVRVPEGRFVIENCWPIPDGDGAGRGVAVDGPVLSRRLAGGRAPGWEAGLVVPRRQQRSDRRGGCGARDADSPGRQLRVRAG